MFWPIEVRFIKWYNDEFITTLDEDEQLHHTIYRLNDDHQLPRKGPFNILHIIGSMHYASTRRTSERLLDLVTSHLYSLETHKKKELMRCLIDSLWSPYRDALNELYSSFVGQPLFDENDWL